MTGAEPNQKLRLAILQRVCTSYRKKLFQRLAQQGNFELQLIIGEDIAGTKVKSTTDLSGLAIEQLPTQVFDVGGSKLIHHRGVIAALKRFEPDVIWCEGDSSLLSYLKAFAYRARHPRVGLMQWSLGALPGNSIDPTRISTRIKRTLYSHFDCIIAYSSFGRDALLKMGVPADRIFPAVNVCDTSHHLAASDEMTLTSAEAKSELGLPDRLMLLYVGAIDPNKRLDELVRAADLLGEDRFHAVIVGDGNALQGLKDLATSLGVTNESFPGRVQQGLSTWYRAADVMVVPGRGGMVISEAMSYAKPVVVYQADGTEFDLVVDGETGVRLAQGTAEEIAERIRDLSQSPERLRAMGEAGQLRIRDRFNQQNMLDKIVAAVNIAHQRRSDR